MRRKGRRDLAVAFALVFAFLSAAVPVVNARTGITVTLNFTSLTIPVGGGRAFTATVTGTATTVVVWSVNDVVGGNPTVGTIDAAGNYVSPANIAVGSNVTVKATSVADSTAFGSCSVTIRNQIPYITSVSPNPLPIGPFNVTVTGSRYVSGAKVFLNGQPLATTFISSTQLAATGTVQQSGTQVINVVNPGPPGATSVNFTLGGNPSPSPTPVPTPSPTPTPKLAVSVTPAAATVKVGATQQFTASVTNSSNTQVQWQVNGVTGGNSTFGTIDLNGIYTAPSNAPFLGVVTVTALSAADGTTKASAGVNIQDPQAVNSARFLEQSTFGPTPALMAHVRQTGINGFLDEQFTLPESPWPDYTTAQRSDAVSALFYNAGTGQDQLRQRTIYALSQIWVVALNKNTNADMIIPHLQILSKNSFGNYRNLMREMTLSSSMGMYLDLVNSTKPGAGVGANENYPRELMQLFTLGLWQLNQDGSQVLDSQGNPIPTYTQSDVQQLARALTGWTYPTPPGKQPGGINYNYYPGVMEPLQASHDISAKTILGQSMLPNQTIQQDLDGALDIIFNHPNVGPFVATRLIRAFVTSNPSPQYISDVAGVFNDNGHGVRGDMQAVIRAILTHPEARNDNPSATFGKLRSPMLYELGLMRALNGSIPQQNTEAYIYYTLGEGMLDPASVFGHYSPLYRIPTTGLFGPEFQIYSPTEAINRGNYLYQQLSVWSGGSIDLNPFINIAANPVLLVNAVDNTLLYGRMSPSTRGSIYKALQASTDNRTRALTALYLTAMSGEYLVQH
jgi:uncharacterized protein (DUF1800 family)